MYLLNERPQTNMSQLSEKIRKAGRAEPAPLGFAAAVATKARPTMLTGVRLTDAGKVADAASQGADFVILDSIAPGKLKGLDKANGASVGVSGHLDREACAALREAGADFAVLSSTSAPATGLLDEKIGRLLAIDPAMDEVSLRLVGDLGLDAVVIPSPELPITVERLIALRRVSALGRTPILADVPSDIESSALELLRDSGVAGVIVGDLGKLGTVKERVDALPARGRKREDHSEATISSQAAAGHDHGDEDDDHDYDD
jgi:hypothetical protein